MDQKQKRRKKRRKKQKLMQKIIPVVIAVALIIIVGGGALAVNLYDQYFAYSKEQANLYEYYEMSSDSQVAIMLQDEIIETKGKMIGGKVYMDIASAKSIINNRFYFDTRENLLIYTTANDMIQTTIGSDTYSVSGEAVSAGYPLTVMEGETLYVALDYVQSFSNITYDYFADPNRIVLRTKWGEHTIATVTKDSAVRLKGGIKSELLREVPKGETLVVLEEMENWNKVKTNDGLVGYIEKKHLSDPVAEQEEVPNVYNAPEYTRVKKDFVINMAWHAIYAEGGNDTFDEMVNGTGTMNIICPTWFSFTDNEGNYTNYASKSYIDKAHSRNMEVWAVVDNVNHPVDSYEFLAPTSKRQRLVQSLMEKVDTYGIDGLNLDFELLPSETVEPYVEFMRELSIECRKRGVALSVDNYSPEGGANYGLAEQGRILDYVVIMGYDEHWGSGGVAGSVASIGFVERGIEAVVNNGVPADKIINGIPFYTRVWKTNGGSVTSDALGMDRTQEFIANNNITTTWDADACQNYGEKEMGGILYQVWIEDAQSIETKLNVMRNHDVAGVAAWQLGQENKSIWKTIDKYVLGQ